MNNDLISRQAAIDAFMMATADGDKAEWCEYIIRQVPCAQPEILRCKDCNLFGQPQCLMTFDGYGWADPDGYCYVPQTFGKKEEENE